MKAIFTLLILITMKQEIVITQYTIGEQYDKYKNKHFFSIDKITCYNYGVGDIYNLYYPENAEPKFKFLEKEVKKVAFQIEKGIINGMCVFIEVNDITNFYSALEQEYGKAQTARISSKYLKDKGYVIPTKLDSHNNKNYYKNLPEPSVADYKNLNGIAWYDLKTNLKKPVETNLYVRNNTPDLASGDQKYIIELKFKVSKY